MSVCVYAIECSGARVCVWLSGSNVRVGQNSLFTSHMIIPNVQKFPPKNTVCTP